MDEVVEQNELENNTDNIVNIIENGDNQQQTIEIMLSKEKELDRLNSKNGKDDIGYSYNLSKITDYDTNNQSRHVDLKLDLSVSNKKLSDISLLKEHMSKKLYTSLNSSINEKINESTLPTKTKDVKDLPSLVNVSKYEDYNKRELAHYLITKYQGVDAIYKKHIHSSKNVNGMMNSNNLFDINEYKEEGTVNIKKRKRLKDITLQDIAPPKNAFYNAFFQKPVEYYKVNPKYSQPSIFEHFYEDKNEHLQNIIKSTQDKNLTCRVKDIPILNNDKKSMLFLTNPLAKKNLNINEHIISHSNTINTNNNENKLNENNFNNINNYNNNNANNINDGTTKYFNKDNSLYPKITNSKVTETTFIRTKPKMIENEGLPLQDKIYNKMHLMNYNYLKLNNKEIIENNKKIKYVMYKNSDKSIDKENLLYDDYMRSPKSFRSKSMQGILKSDKNYLKYKKEETEMRRKMNIY